MIEKTKTVLTTDYTNVLIADVSVVIFLWILSFFWREQRLGLFVASLVYLFFTYMWHYPPGLLSY